MASPASASVSAEPVVLVLGSGLCCPPLVAYLASHRIGVLLASRTVKRAEASRDLLPPADRAFVQCVQYDIEVDDAAAGSPGLRALLALPSVRVGISMLPYIHHVQAAKVAVSLKKHFLTTSYVSPAMAELDASARAAGVLLLNECGVDPGLDHMSAQQLIDRVHAQGGKIRSFYSLCGGLPAPSAAPNPLQYKLSWSPRGVLLASRNAATYLLRGERKEVSGARLYEHGEGYRVEQFGSGGIGALEFYPNRDSTPYRAIYGIEECMTILRGTYRHAGWSRFMKHLTLLGYTSMDEQEFAQAREEAKPAAFTMASLTRFLAKRRAAASGVAVAEPAADASGDALQAYTAAALGLAPSDEVLGKFAWLGCFDASLPLPMSSGVGLAVSALDAMSNRWEKLLQYEEGEKDMIAMKHSFEVEFPAAGAEAASAGVAPPAVRRERWTSTLVYEGQAHPDGSIASAMSLTVALPVGAACRALLEGRLPASCVGVTRPVDPALYNLILEEMASLGVRFHEQRQPLHFHLRAEVKKGERRAALTPTAVAELIKGGAAVTVERCAQRAIPAESYAAAGATLAEAGSWVDAPESAVILGLKELPEGEPRVLYHRHVFFAHAYKHQAGWREVLKRFTSPSSAAADAKLAAHGLLYDLEFLVDSRGVRVCAFGRQAGMVGMALGLLQYAARVGGAQSALQAPLQPWGSYDAMIAAIRAALERLPEALRAPKVLILGALGRCGSGAVAVCNSVGLSGAQVSAWDQAETKAGGPFDAVAQHDVLVNCVYLPPGAQLAPFATLESLAAAGSQRKLTTVVDVSCDASAANNPLPLYKGCTTLDEPVQRVQLPAAAGAAAGGQLPPLDVISIDHLPALLPVESTEGFSAALAPHLLALAPDAPNNESSAIWQRAAELFNKKLHEAVTTA